ncbi:MAG TPA: molybdopterin-binding protein, partial [Candidatus Bathyarchaeia archaeon]|nr:molybdopterin-binding protein [Candidatus Bathyarchaeia archaeon]
LGTKITRTTVIADNVNEIANTLREALQRKPQFIITTGGLGPTFDDKTLQGIAKALNRKLEVNPEALDNVKEKYAAYARKKNVKTVELTQPRIKMATIPEKTAPIRNPVGTASAVRVDVNGTVIFALPGVPKEMEAIFEESIAPLLHQASKGCAFYEKSIYADEIMESTLATLIDTVMQDNSGVYIKSHPRGAENKPNIEIHFSITSTNNQKSQEKLEVAANQLSQLITRSNGKVYTQNQVET